MQDERPEPDKVIGIGPLKFGLVRRREPIPEFQRLAEAVDELKATIWREWRRLLATFVVILVAAELVIFGGHAAGLWDAW